MRGSKSFFVPTNEVVVEFDVDVNVVVERASVMAVVGIVCIDNVVLVDVELVILMCALVVKLRV